MRYSLTDDRHDIAPDLHADCTTTGGHSLDCPQRAGYVQITTYTVDGITVRWEGVDPHVYPLRMVDRWDWDEWKRQRATQ